MLPFEQALAGRRILVTGHTGFTGSWAVHWLSALGAELHGLSLAPETQPNMFEATGAEAELAGHHIGDIRDRNAVERAVSACAPELILHLAAQPLVRRSYVDPVQTYETNLIGTVNVLEAARHGGVGGVVCITTDKVYANREWIYGYRETDRLGGSDPYSASKACAELAIDSYRRSLPSWGQKMHVAVARGGNIIGGGDWAEDRLIPDFARAMAAGQSIVLRNPGATRPWQHVVCLVHGYLMLMARMAADGPDASGSWNFGPSMATAAPVGDVVERLARRWSHVEVRHEPSGVHESGMLALDSTKAEKLLGWRAGWDLDEALENTAAWYAGYYADPGQARAMTRAQIAQYRDNLAG